MELRNSGRGKKKNIAQRRRGAEKNSKEKAVKAEDNQACGYKRGRLTKSAPKGWHCPPRGGCHQLGC